MGFSDIDKKAAEKYTPSKFLKLRAEKVGADIRNATGEEDARRRIKEAEDKKQSKGAETKPISGEVLPPLRNGHDHGTVHPQFVFNVPSIHANVTTVDAPQWFEVVAHVKDAVLWMVLGAALMAIARGVLGI